MGGDLVVPKMDTQVIDTILKNVNEGATANGFTEEDISFLRPQKVSAKVRASFLPPFQFDSPEVESASHFIMAECLLANVTKTDESL